MPAGRDSEYTQTISDKDKFRFYDEELIPRLWNTLNL